MREHLQETENRRQMMIILKENVIMEKETVLANCQNKHTYIHT